MRTKKFKYGAYQKILAAYCLLSNHRVKHDLDSTQSFARIVIYSTTALGDFMFSTPAIRSVRKRYPAAKIMLVVDPKLKSLINEDYQEVNQVLYWNGKWKGMFALSKKLKVYKPELAISLHAHAPYDILCSVLAKIPYIVINHFCFELEGFSPWVSFAKVPAQDHLIQERMDTLIPLGCDISDVSMEVPCMYTHLPKKRDRKIVGLQMGTSVSDLSRRWPVPHFVALAKKLIELNDYRVEIALIGAPNELSLATEFLASLSDDEKKYVLSYVGQTNLVELVGVIEQMDVLVTPDTGPLHLAVALRTPVVTLFASNTGAQPYQDLALHTVLLVNADAAGERLPMSSILPEDVLPEIRQKIAI